MICLLGVAIIANSADLFAMRRRGGRGQAPASGISVIFLKLPDFAERPPSVTAGGEPVTSEESSEGFAIRNFADFIRSHIDTLPQRPACTPPEIITLPGEILPYGELMLWLIGEGRRPLPDGTYKLKMTTKEILLSETLRNCTDRQVFNNLEFYFPVMVNGESVALTSRAYFMGQSCQVILDTLGREMGYTSEDTGRILKAAEEKDNMVGFADVWSQKWTEHALFLMCSDHEIGAAARNAHTLALKIWSDCKGKKPIRREDLDTLDAHLLVMENELASEKCLEARYAGLMVALHEVSSAGIALTGKKDQSLSLFKAKAEAAAMMALPPFIQYPSRPILLVANRGESPTILSLVAHGLAMGTSRARYKFNSREGDTSGITHTMIDQFRRFPDRLAQAYLGGAIHPVEGAHSWRKVILALEHWCTAMKKWAICEDPGAAAEIWTVVYDVMRHVYGLIARYEGRGTTTKLLDEIGLHLGNPEELAKAFLEAVTYGKKDYESGSFQEVMARAVEPEYYCADGERSPRLYQMSVFLQYITRDNRSHLLRAGDEPCGGKSYTALLPGATAEEWYEALVEGVKTGRIEINCARIQGRDLTMHVRLVNPMPGVREMLDLRGRPTDRLRLVLREDDELLSLINAYPIESVSSVPRPLPALTHIPADNEE
jgi:hypothetical protein